MKHKLLIVITSVAALAFCLPLTASAARAKKSASPAPDASASPAASAAASATKTSPSAAASPAVKSERPLPFDGMISATDPKAKTFTIAGKEKSRVFKMTDKTVFMKGGAPATMKDVVANEEARGSYWKAADGSLEVKSVKLGPMTEAEKALAARHPKKKAKAAPPADASPSATPKP